MSRLPAASFEEALHALDFILGWAGGMMPVDVLEDRPWTWWHTTGERGSGARLARVVRMLDERSDVEVSVGVPWSRLLAGGVGRTTAAWVRVEGEKQLAAARRFRPLPSLVVQEGSSSRRVLLWALERPLAWSEAKAVNRRIAYKLGARQKDGDPDLVRIAVPGTCLRKDRARPAPVRVTRLSTATFDPEVFAVSRWLKEPPDATAWMSG